MKVRLRVLAATAALLVLAGCARTGADEPVNGAAGDGYVGGGGNVLTRIPPDQRRPAPPAASGPELGGSRTISTADYAGRVVVVNVWGSWCAPCRKEGPDLQQASVRTAAKAQFLGINSRDPAPAPALAFVRAAGVTYPSIYDPDGKVLLTYAGTLPLSTFPSTLVLDRQGRVSARIAGPTSTLTLVQLVDDVAAGL